MMERMNTWKDDLFLPEKKEAHLREFEIDQSPDDGDPVKDIR